MKQSMTVVGLQWGDEGKGKVIDAIAGRFDYVVRWNGGNNAGHTVSVAGERYPLSLVPSGVIAGKKLLISQGVVINPTVLLTEISFLQQKGFRVDLTIDPRCHVVMPYHALMDAASEQWKGKDATGSLRLGIGYCYEDRNNRSGIRLEFLTRPKLLREKLEKIVPLKLAILRKAYGMRVTLSVGDLVAEYARYGKKLASYVGDVSRLVSVKLATQAFLFALAHAPLLDPVFGTYPFTVAPPTLASAVFPSVGIPARSLPVLGVTKAYTTRVGNGPFPTELTNATGERIRQNGHEFGTVSKRPRRCGWLDVAVLRYSIRLNGATMLAVTKLDVLSGLPKIGVCVGYRLGRKIITEFPSQIADLASCRPEYRWFRGWKEPITSVRRFSRLPREAQQLIRFIAKETGVPVRFVSVGPDRKEFLKV